MSQPNNSAVRCAIVGFALLALIGCGSSPQSTSKPTATPFPTVAPFPSVAPFPTVPSSATVAPQRTATSTANASPTATAASGLGAVLFQDDFSDPKSGWQTGKLDCCQFEYQNDAYRIVAAQDNTAFSLLPNRTFDNISVEVDVTKVGGPASGIYGIACRVSDNYDKAYVFAIRADGAHVIFKTTSNGQTELKVALSASAIKTGTATNHLRADCVGSRFTLYANGEKLIEATDNQYASGKAGMVVSTQPNGGDVEARFDNFVVRSATP